MYHLTKALKSFGRAKISEALDLIEKEGFEVQDDVVVVGDVVLKKKDRRIQDPEIIILLGRHSQFFINPR